MRLATVLSDHPTGERKSVEVGVTDMSEAGFVYLMARDNEKREFLGVYVVEHFSPSRARELAYALLDAASDAEDDAGRAFVQHYLNQ